MGVGQGLAPAEKKSQINGRSKPLPYDCHNMLKLVDEKVLNFVI